MPISRRQFLTLLEDGVIRITPYSQEHLKDNHYVLHNDGFLSFYDEAFGRNNVIDSSKPPKLTKIEIPKYGYTLEPNRLYRIQSRESVVSDDWSCSATPAQGLSEYGLLINVDSDVAYKCSGIISATLTSIHPLIIYPGQNFADLYVQENEPGIGYVPIGGIIGWSGGSPPYGYRICDGTHGTPDLRNRFIVGGDQYGVTGGSNRIRLGVENLPSHMHQIDGHDVVYIKPDALSDTTEGTPVFTTSRNIEYTGESAIDKATGKTSVAAEIDNRPAFTSMIFIMRYK